MNHGYADSLKNVVANLGTDRDKAAASYYTMPVQDAGQLAAMYRGSAIAKKIVDRPAKDAFREWREWQASADEISKIEAEEIRLGLIGKCLLALRKARLFGGAAIYIGTGESNPSLPLNPERIKLNGIRYLTVLGRDALAVKNIERDPRSAQYGRPDFYTMQTGGGSLMIHPSRLVIFQGEEHLDDRFSGADLGWGDSTLTSCLTNIRDMDATMANVASLVFEAKVDVIGIPNLMQSLQSGGDQYEKLLLRRATLAQTGKGINGTLLTDSEETHSQKTASFSNLPNVIDRFMQMTSAAADIPMTLLFGMSPGGLNATGDADTRGYYDSVKVTQTLGIQPEMSVLDECLIRSALGSRPDEIFYNWRPLWQPTAKEKADTGKVIVETLKAAMDMQVIPDEAIGNAVVNGLTESGLAPGLEAEFAEFGGGEKSGVDLEEDDLDRMNDAGL